LSATKISFRPDRLKVQKLRDKWWIFEDIRPVLEIGTQADAELMIRVIRSFDLKSLCLFGRPESGGLRLFTAGR
jgi:hypothetical protein